jgi:hypothetical protein
MTDEVFFGVWDGADWTVAPKLDYTANERMARVGEYAAQGEYVLAARAFFDYCKNYKLWDPAESLTAAISDSGASAMIAEQMFFNPTQGSGDYLTQATVRGTQWQKAQFDVTNFVNNKGTFGFYITPLQKADADVQISGIGGGFCPTLTIITDGNYVQLQPIRTYTLSPGSRADDPDTLLARQCGMPYNSDSKMAYFIFDAEDYSRNVTAASFEVLVKSYTEDDLTLPLGVAHDPDALDTSWKDQVQRVYNYYGATADEFDWSLPLDAALIWNESLSRLDFIGPLVNSYVETRDEFYAESAIRLMLDLFYDHGNGLSKYRYTGSAAALNGGGWPNALVVAVRVMGVCPRLSELVKSKYMTAERFAEIMKNIFLTAEWLRDNDQIEVPPGAQEIYTAYGPRGNEVTYMVKGILTTAVVFPEFAYAEHWYDLALRRIEWYAGNCVLTPDNAYIEASPHYSRGAYVTLIPFLKYVPEGSAVYESLLRVLLPWSEYNYMQSLTPAGDCVRYGDNPASGAGAMFSDFRSGLSAILKYAEDDGLRYFYSAGKEGKAPAETSKLYPVKGEAFLRTGWDRDDLFLFVNNDKGVGGHQHPDDLAVVAAAYGRTLLADTGTVTYNETAGSTDVWMRYTTEAHNTVTINDQAQAFYDNMSITNDNDTHYWTTQAEFDFWQGNTKTWDGFTHDRAITFVRPNYWIVSDIIVPEDGTRVNNYKQNWHAPAHFEIAGNKGRANVIDASIQVVQSDTEHLQTSAPIGYMWVDALKRLTYMRSEKNTAGQATFDTILYPNSSNDLTEVFAEKIVAGANSTASKITFEDGANVTRDYYYLSYQVGGTFPVGYFDKYSFDGKTAVCETDAAGRTIAVNMAFGTAVTEDGADLVRADRVAENMTVEWDSNLKEIKVTLAGDAAGTKIRIYAPRGTEEITLNGELREAERDGDYCILYV